MIDFLEAGAMLSLYAGVGALIGSCVPVIGTLIGAVVGLSTGLFISSYAGLTDSFHHGYSRPSNIYKIDYTNGVSKEI